MGAAVAPVRERAAAQAAAVGAMFGTITAIDSLVHLPKALFERAWDPIWYVADFLPIGAAQLQRSVQISANRDFVCMGGTIIARDPANQLTVMGTPYTVKVQLSGQQSVIAQGENNEGFVDVQSMFGDRGQGNSGRWPVANLIRRNSQIATLLQPLDAVSRNVRIAYFGFSVY